MNIRKQRNRKLAIVLVLVTIMSSIRFTALANTSEIVLNKSKHNDKVSVVKELVDQRTEYADTYLLSDGSKELQVHGSKIRYKENGKLKEYDTNIRKLRKEEKESVGRVKGKNASKYLYVNKSGDSKHFFPRKLSKNTGIVLKYKECFIEMAPVISDLQKGNEKTKDIYINADTGNAEMISESLTELYIKNNEIMYAGEEHNVLYQYISLTDGVKENIILNSKPENSVFEYEISTENIYLKKEKMDKGIQVFDSNTDKIVGYINPPNIQDGDGNIDYESVSYELKKTRGKIILIMSVDEKYFEQDTLKYPVTVDPTMIWQFEYITTTGISEYMPDSRIQNNLLYVYNYANDSTPVYRNENRIYLDTTNLLTGKALVGSGDLFTGKLIESASLRFFEGDLPPQYSHGGTVQVKRALDSWDPTTITWNTQPNISMDYVAETECLGKLDTEHVLDITKWVEKLADGTYENNGLVFTCPNRGSAASIYSPEANYLVDENGKYIGIRHMSISVIYREENELTKLDYNTMYESTFCYENYDENMSDAVEIGYIPPNLQMGNSISTYGILPGGSLTRVIPDKYPYSTVVSLTTNINGGGYGSGFVIGPNVIATAAHCVFNKAGWVKNIKVVSQYKTKNQRVYNVKEIYRPSKYAYYCNALDTPTYNKRFQYDWALLIVDGNIGQNTGWLGFEKSNQLLNTNIKVVGYTSYNTLEYPGTNLFEGYGQITQVDEKGIDYNASTLGGQSGGAVLNEANIACGIHTYGVENVKNGGTKISALIYNLFLEKKREGISLYTD